MANQHINSIILEELRSLRGSFKDPKENTAQRLTTLETQMSTLVAPRPVPARPILVVANPRARKSRPS